MQLFSVWNICFLFLTVNSVPERCRALWTAIVKCAELEPSLASTNQLDQSKSDMLLNGKAWFKPNIKCLLHYFFLHCFNTCVTKRVFSFCLSTADFLLHWLLNVSRVILVLSVTYNVFWITVSCEADSWRIHTDPFTMKPNVCSEVGRTFDSCSSVWAVHILQENEIIDIVLMLCAALIVCGAGFTYFMYS